MSESLLRLPSVKARVGLSRTIIYELMADGKFPRPIRPYESARMVAWVASDVDAWVAARIAAATRTNGAANGHDRVDANLISAH